MAAFFCMDVAFYSYYEKVRRTMRTAILLYLLKINESQYTALFVEINESQYTALFVVADLLKNFSQLIASIFTFLNQQLVIFFQ